MGRWDAPWLEGLTLTGGAIHTGSRYVNQANTQKLDDWTRFDVGARYSTRIDERPTTFRATVQNVFDHEYWSGVASWRVLARRTAHLITVGDCRLLKRSAGERCEPLTDLTFAKALTMVIFDRRRRAFSALLLAGLLSLFAMAPRNAHATETDSARTEVTDLLGAKSRCICLSGGSSSVRAASCIWSLRWTRQTRSNASSAGART